MAGIRVESGNLFFLYAYDIGFDVDLARATGLTGAEESPGLTGIRPAPPHLQYRPKPLVVPAGIVEIRVGPTTYAMEASVKIFDFGALSVTLSQPVRDMAWEEYAATAILLATGSRVEEEARRVAERLFGRIRPAVARAEFADIVEEYSLWHVGRFVPDMTGSTALATLGQDIARLLMLEAGRFDEAALVDILRNPIRYFENDLLLAEWNAAFAYDPRFQDTVEVLEFLNVQMVEWRFFDRLLHEAIDEMDDEIHRRRRTFLLHDPYEKSLRRLSEFKMDIAMLRERVNNALKLVGDAYLVRVYEEARRKVGAGRWEETTRDQLKTLEDIYTVLNNRAAASRAETLEMVIILLIMIEIVMGLLRR
jgi:hypothetical protein